MVSTHYLFLTSLLAALNLSPSVIARPSSAGTIPPVESPPPVTPKPPIKSAWREFGKAAELPIANISWTKYNTMTWAFAEVSRDCNIIIDDPSGPSDLSAFVRAAHDNNVTALVSVGGADTTNFSPCFCPEKSQHLVDSVVNFTETHQLDGIEFDWVCSNSTTNTPKGCDKLSPNDTANFLAVLTQLRAAVRPDMTITLAVGPETFLDSSGTPATNMSAWAGVLDYITIKAYDIFGSWSSVVGPNSPLNDTDCLPKDVSGSASESVATGVYTWVNAGFRSDQIVIAVASYGHGYDVSLSNALDPKSGEIAHYPPFNGIPYGSNDHPEGSSFYQKNDSFGNPNTPTGTYDFRGMIGLNYLTTDGTNATGVDYRFDNCSQTPYIYILDEQIMISYDDAASFAAKGSYIKKAGLRGFQMLHVEGDYNDTLLDAINSTMSCFPV